MNGVVVGDDVVAVWYLDYGSLKRGPLLRLIVFLFSGAAARENKNVETWTRDVCRSCSIIISNGSGQRGEL